MVPGKQCAAICPPNVNGQPALTCDIDPVSGPPVKYWIDCWGMHNCPMTVPPNNGGRRPGYFASLGFGPAPVGRELGTHFARVACMEASSVDAFRILRDELRAHHAPRRLVRWAARAMQDELRHVRQTSALARRFSEKPIAPIRAGVRAPRRFEEVAVENAVEGCVRET